MKSLRPFVLASVSIALTVLLLINGVVRGEAPKAEGDLAKQIFDVMVKIPGVAPGHRPVHAKGIVCQGTFASTGAGAAISSAAHFQKDASVPVTVRFSDGAPDPAIPDGSPNAGPRGMAIRFTLPGGDETDIVAMSHNGFVVSTGEEFLALQQSVLATDPTKPHPWPVEAFLGAHPRALKFVQENQVAPASFATIPFFSNDAFDFVSKSGAKQAGRYFIVPTADTKHLSEAEAKAQTSDYLADDLKKRLGSEPVTYRLIVQLPNPGDPTKDPSVVWGDDRKTIEVGTVSIKSIDPSSDAAEKKLAFDPTNLTSGIELSDDPFPALRSSVYALSVKHRHKTEQKP